jgi:BlaI family transcriptional regulator, penicillinase repressor
MDVRLSDAEVEVMETLWGATGPLTATEVAERVPSDRHWSLATVKSLLSRLLAKKAIEPARDGRRFLYTATVERSSYIGAESRRFVRRLYGGKLSPLIAQMAEEEALDKDDMAEIEALLRRLKQ